jgi:outer membrane protein W
MFRSREILNLMAILVFCQLTIAQADTVVVTQGQQQQALEQSNEGVLNSDPIDINGYVKQAPQATDSELEYLKQELQKQQNEVIINKQKEKGYKELQKTTEKLVDATEDYLEEKKESQGAIEAYNAKLKCLMDESRDPKTCDEDKVQVQQAAISKTTVQKEDINNDGSSYVVVPFTGIKTYNFNNFNNPESNTHLGVRVESDVSANFDLGAGFTYTQTNNILVGQSLFNQFGFLNPFNPGFQNNGIRRIDHEQMSLEFYGKYNWLNKGRFKVYTGLGLSYNRTEQTIEASNGLFNPFGGGFVDLVSGNANFVGMRLFAGSRFDVNNNWGNRF